MGWNILYNLVSIIIHHVIPFSLFRTQNILEYHPDLSLHRHVLSSQKSLSLANPRFKYLTFPYETSAKTTKHSLSTFTLREKHMESFLVIKEFPYISLNFFSFLGHSLAIARDFSFFTLSVFFIAHIPVCKKVKNNADLSFTQWGFINNNI